VHNPNTTLSLVSCKWLGPGVGGVYGVDKITDVAVLYSTVCNSACIE